MSYRAAGDDDDGDGGDRYSAQPVPAGDGGGMRVVGRENIFAARNTDEELHFTSIFLTCNSNTSTGYGDDFRTVADDLGRVFDSVLADSTTLAAILLGPEHLDRAPLIEEVRVESVGFERGERQRRVHMHAALTIRHRTRLSLGVMGHGFKVVLTELLQQMGYRPFVSLRLGDATRQNYIMKDRNQRVRTVGGAQRVDAAPSDD